MKFAWANCAAQLLQLFVGLVVPLYLYLLKEGHIWVVGTRHREASASAPLGKRKRSLSIQKLKTQLTAISEKQQENTNTAEEEAGARRSIHKLKARAHSTGELLHDVQDSDIEADENEDETVMRADVLSKYKTCGKIVDDVLVVVCAACVPGATTFELCRLGDAKMKEALKGVFAHAKNELGEKIPKGICFPTNVSVNSILCNHAPFTAEGGVVLSAGDIVKVHLGCHLDGYPVSAATTIVCGKVESMGATAANTVAAAHSALNTMIHLVRPDATNGEVTDAIHAVGAQYQVEPVEGVLSTRTKRWIMDCSDVIIARRVFREEPQQDVAPCTFAPFQVWSLDVAFTNAPSYKIQVADEPVSILRKNEVSSSLRLAAAEQFLHEIRTKFFCFPFHLLNCETPLKAKLACGALRKGDMIDDYPTLRCKPPHIVSRFSCTIAITEKRTHVLCGAPGELEGAIATCVDKQLDPTLQDLIRQPLVYGATLESSRKKTRKE